jgi:hypothetical protein
MRNPVTELIFGTRFFDEAGIRKGEAFSVAKHPKLFVRTKREYLCNLDATHLSDKTGHLPNSAVTGPMRNAVNSVKKQCRRIFLHNTTFISSEGRCRVSTPDGPFHFTTLGANQGTPKTLGRSHCRDRVKNTPISVKIRFPR